MPNLLRRIYRAVFVRGRHRRRPGVRQMLVLRTEPNPAATQKTLIAPPERDVEQTMVIPAVGDLSWLGSTLALHGSGRGWLPDGVQLDGETVSG